MHSSRLSVEPFHDELGVGFRLIQTGLNDVVLMDTFPDFAVPYSNTSKLLTTSVTFNKENVPWLQSVIGHLIIRHVDRLDLSEVEVASLDVGDAEIGAGVFAGSIGRAFLESVAHRCDLAKWHDFELGLRQGVAKQSGLQDSLVAPAFYVLETGDLKCALGEVYRRREPQGGFEFSLCLPLDMLGLGFQLGRLCPKTSDRLPPVGAERQEKEEE